MIMMCLLSKAQKILKISLNNFKTEEQQQAIPKLSYKIALSLILKKTRTCRLMGAKCNSWDFLALKKCRVCLKFKS